MRFSVSFIIVAIMNKKRQTEQVRRRKTDGEIKQREKCNLCKSQVIWWSCKTEKNKKQKTVLLSKQVTSGRACYETRFLHVDSARQRFTTPPGTNFVELLPKSVEHLSYILTILKKKNVWFGLTKSADVVSSRLFLSQVVCKWSTETLDRWQ